MLGRCQLLAQLHLVATSLQACENFRCLCTGEKGVGKASGQWLLQPVFVQ